MKFSLNEVLLLGNVVRAPELKFTPNGNKVAKFTLATNRSYLDKASNKWVDIPSFHDVTVWGNLAGFIAENLFKGEKACVKGRIDYQQWTDNKGEKKYRTVIVADEVISLSKKQTRTTNDNVDFGEPGTEDVDFMGLASDAGFDIENPEDVNQTPF